VDKKQPKNETIHRREEKWDKYVFYWGNTNYGHNERYLTHANLPESQTPPVKLMYEQHP
jgi:hypothetical protein